MQVGTVGSLRLLAPSFLASVSEFLAARVRAGAARPSGTVGPLSGGASGQPQFQPVDRLGCDAILVHTRQGIHLAAG